jgi:Protein of unknown function (DUF2812).
MRQVIHKVFFIWNVDKEEKWLNEMSTKGLQLIDVGFCKYVFEEGAVGEYQYRIELLESFPKHPESAAYIHFLEDTGAEHVGSCLRWVYFRKKASEGVFDLFSDIDSRIKYLKRLMGFFFAVLVLNMFAMFLNISVYYVNSTMVNLICSFISLGISVMIILGIVTFSKRINRFKKERLLRE